MGEPALLEWTRLEQRRRWQQNDPVSVEFYLEQQPALRADIDAVLDLIYNEIVLREERGELPSLDEYLRRFPQCEPELRRQFEVHHILEDLSSTNIDSRRDQSAAAISPGLPEGAPAVAIPGYTILGELGRGGMGVVYKALQVGLNRQVAVKMILGGAHAGTNAIARFRAEAEAVARLQHPHIVQIHEIGEQDGLPYFSLELVDGVGLDRQLAGTPQAPREAARLVQILARTMHYAHVQGIIHRDLKPANILLQREQGNARQGDRETTRQEDNTSQSPDSQVSLSPCLLVSLSSFCPKITDFGLAKLIQPNGNESASPAFVGTPNYMAPEQAGGMSGRAGPSADIYSLGAILYEMLTGQPPFVGTTLLDTVRQVKSEEPIPPSRLQTKVPTDLETICLKCLEKEPGKRYLSARDLAEDLRRFLADEPILARPASAWQRVHKWAKRRPASAALVAGCFGLLLAAIVALPWYGRIRDQEARQQALETYQSFFQLHDRALFHAQRLQTIFQETLAAGAPSGADFLEVESTSREALSLVERTTEPGSPLTLDRRFDDRQRDEISAGCYTLHLVLAEAVARTPRPDRAAGERYREGLRILAQASRFGSPTRAYHLRRARYLDQLGDHELASSEREQAASLPPGTTLDYFLRGYEWYERGNVQEAKGALDKALALQPNHFWAGYYLALCHLKGQSWEAAKACLTTCLGRQPEFIWPYLLRGIAHARLNEFESALADFEKALECGPQEDAIYCLHVNRGLMRLQEGQLALAAGDLQQAIALKPLQYHAYINLAHVYQRQKQHEAALQQLDQAIGLEPPERVLAECHAERARNLYLAGKYDSALSACAAALRIRPNYPVVFGLRGFALLELKRHEEAARAFDKYLEQGGEPMADIYRGRGLIRVKRGDYLGARDDYTRALGFKADADLYTHRGWAYVFADAWKPALNDFENALRLNPRSSDAHIGRGLARVMLPGSYASAVEDAEAALGLAVDTPEMLHNIACIYAQAAARVDNKLVKQPTQTLASGFRERSAQAIRAALAKLPSEDRDSFWREKIRPDTALDPIRQSSEFKQLEKEFGPSGGTK